MNPLVTRDLHRFIRLAAFLLLLLTVSVVGAQEAPISYDTPGAPITEEQAAAFIERFDALFNEPNTDIADELFAEDFVAHMPLAPNLDLAGWKAFAGSFLSGASDLTHDTNAIYVADDRLIVYTTITGTHDGEILGVPATGNPIEMNAIGIFRFNDDGLVTESWAILDVATLLAQIGAMPADGTTAPEATANLNAPGALITEEAAAAFAERFDALFNEPNTDIADELFAEDFAGHLPLAPMLDREGWKAYVDSFRAGASDTTQTTNAYWVNGDRLILHVTYNGTHDGVLFGVPATGNPISMDGIGIFRFNEDGLAAENWAALDLANVFAQIGIIPPAS